MSSIRAANDKTEVSIDDTESVAMLLAHPTGVIYVNDLETGEKPRKKLEGFMFPLPAHPLDFEHIRFYFESIDGPSDQPVHDQRLAEKLNLPTSEIAPGFAPRYLLDIDKLEDSIESWIHVIMPANHSSGHGISQTSEKAVIVNAFSERNIQDTQEFTLRTKNNKFVKKKILERLLSQ